MKCSSVKDWKLVESQFFFFLHALHPENKINKIWSNVCNCLSSLLLPDRCLFIRRIWVYLCHLWINYTVLKRQLRPQFNKEAYIQQVIEGCVVYWGSPWEGKLCFGLKEGTRIRYWIRLLLKQCLETTVRTMKLIKYRLASFMISYVILQFWTCITNH